MPASALFLGHTKVSPGKVPPSTPGLPWALRTLQPGLSLFCRQSLFLHTLSVQLPECSWSFLVSLKSSWNPPGRLMLFLVTSPKSGSASFLLLAPPTTLCFSAAFLRGPRVICTYLLLRAEWELLEGRALSCSSTGGDVCSLGCLLIVCLMPTSRTRNRSSYQRSVRCLLVSHRLFPRNYINYIEN